MLKGRRGRVSPNTFTRRKYSTRNGTSKIKNECLEERRITNYFKCADDDLGYTDVDIKRNYDDKFLMLVEEKLLDAAKQSYASAFSPKSPHRIQLNPDEPDSKAVTDDMVPMKYVTQDVFRSSLVKKVKKTKTETDHKLTEYFPIRRSERKTKRIVLEEKQRNLEQLLRDGTEEGLQVHYFEGKGRGVVAVRPFNRGDFVVEYSGELLDVAEAKVREAKYAEDESTGCYMYYFKHLNQQYCIDATAESGRLGRLVNHSRNGNLLTRTVVVDGYPHLVLIAKDHIGTGEEISYDYGDRSKESLKNHPWLAL